MASPPPTGIGDPALCGSQPPFPYVDLETRGFAVFLCFLVCILVKIDSRSGHCIWFCVFGFYCLLIPAQVIAWKDLSPK